MSLLVHISRVFTVLSIVSIGGANSTLSEIRRQVVDVNVWMDGATFNDIFAISHAAPGPNIIMVSLIGWHLSGLAGLLVATAAIMIPSCTMAFIVSRALVRFGHHPAISLIKESMVPIAVGMILASGITMVRMADGNALTIFISLASAAIIATTSRNPLWTLAAGTCVNIVAMQLSGT